MLRRNKLITNKDTSRIEEWLDVLEGTLNSVLQRYGDELVFSHYKRYCESESGRENQFRTGVTQIPIFSSIHLAFYNAKDDHDTIVSFFSTVKELPGFGDANYSFIGFDPKRDIEFDLNFEQAMKLALSKSGRLISANGSYKAGRLGNNFASIGKKKATISIPLIAR